MHFESIDLTRDHAQRPSSRGLAGFEKKSIFYCGQNRVFGVWYPTDQQGNVLYDSHIQGNACAQASLSPGVYPLVIVNHGAGGRFYSHSYLCEFLAQNGFVVLAPQWENKLSASQNLYDLFYRPFFTEACLQAVFKDSFFQGSIDEQAISLIGFSAGAFLSLQLMGLQPDFCRDLSFAPYLKDYDFSIPFPKIRAKSCVLLAPGLMHLFPKSELMKNKVPFTVSVSERDEVVSFEDQQVFAKVPSCGKGFVYLDAGHYVFNRTYPEMMKRMYPKICGDVGVDRALVHGHVCGHVLASLTRANLSLSLSSSTSESTL
jgi:predicted dienelactone hydrolase